MRHALLAAYRLVYEAIVRPLIFRSQAHVAHQRMLRMLAAVDRFPLADRVLDFTNRMMFEKHRVNIGGVCLPTPLILAAGLVKGEGFASEAEALETVARGCNVMPGWQSIPRLVGTVEFGSFTRHPRLGNPGVVVWRHERSRSTQNRVGLRNPGAAAAAAFLASNRTKLPSVFGINIAVSPGVTGLNEQVSEVLECFAAFVERGVLPSWFTLNLSCPNTEDDPGGRQTEELTHVLCRSVLDYLERSGVNLPLWVKIGPELAPEQYAILLRVFHEVGVRAVIATNTLPRPAPTDPSLIAGVGGGTLHPYALDAVRYLAQLKAKHGYAVDVIGCGGALDGSTYSQLRIAGAAAVQYWSAIIYRGPLAAALMLDEVKRDGRNPHTGGTRPA